MVSMNYSTAISILRKTQHNIVCKEDCRAFLGIYTRKLTLRDCKKCILTEYCSHDSMMTREIIINDLNKKARSEKLKELLA